MFAATLFRIFCFFRLLSKNLKFKIYKHVIAFVVMAHGVILSQRPPSAPPQFFCTPYLLKHSTDCHETSSERHSVEEHIRCSSFLQSTV